MADTGQETHNFKIIPQFLQLQYTFKHYTWGSGDWGCGRLHWIFFYVDLVCSVIEVIDFAGVGLDGSVTNDADYAGVG